MERKKIIDGTRVAPGDVLLGLASAGLHSNGYTLARRIVFDVMRLSPADRLPGTSRPVLEELLEPTRIYVKSVLELLRRVDVHAMAHVTGGGITGNLPRVLPEGCGARVRRSTWDVPAVFRALQDAGRVDEREMFRTFNMGVGYLIVVADADADVAIRTLESAGERVFRLGDITAGLSGVELIP